MTATRPALRNIAEIRSFFRTNDEPIYFVGPTGFNLLGLDRWVRHFNYITYYDAWDGAHPRMITPRFGREAEFTSSEDIVNFLLRHPEVQARLKADGGRPRIAAVFFDEETEAICAELGYRLILPSHALRSRLDSKITTTRLGNQAGAPSVPNVLATVSSYSELQSVCRQAGLGDDLVEHAVGVVEEPLLGATHDARAAVKADRLPLRPGFSRPSGHRGQLVGAQDRNRADHFAGGRILHRDRVRIGVVGLRRNRLFDARHGYAGSSSIDSIEGGSVGRSWRPVGVASIASTASMPAVTWPKTVCLPSSHGAASMVTMKNCEPLVLGPALAIASAPRTTLCWLNSSSKVYPGPPLPVPCGSPPWIMKSGMTRWKMTPS